MNLTGGVVVTIIGYGTFTASCPANYTLFHCGVGNVQQTYCDPFRYATPIKSTTCQCRDNHWAGCLAYCRPVNPAGYQVHSLKFSYGNCSRKNWITFTSKYVPVKLSSFFLTSPNLNIVLAKLTSDYLRQHHWKWQCNLSGRNKGHVLQSQAKHQWS